MKTIWFTILTLMTLGATAQQQTEHVILITFDGLRWQELYAGADQELIGDQTFVSDTGALIKEFWREDLKKRREVLMPFFWEVIAKEGQLYGNRVYDNKVNVSNRYWFSYPGYHEILVGYNDNRINSNRKMDNPNVTVLEFINRHEEFKGRVAAFGSWDVFPYIINETRSGIPVNAGFRGASGSNLTPKEEMLNELQPQVPSPWSSVRLDAFTHHYALEYLKKERPRLLYIAYGETDDFAHDGEYDQYLHAARRTDQFIKELWEWVQADSEYSGRTTFIITTDHGRGETPKETWKHHGRNIKDCDQIWLAVMGPDTPALGELKTSGQYYQNQVAKTVATMLGVDYVNERVVGELIQGVVN